MFGIYRNRPFNADEQTTYLLSNMNEDNRKACYQNAGAFFAQQKAILEKENNKKADLKDAETFAEICFRASSIIATLVIKFDETGSENDVRQIIATGEALLDIILDLEKKLKVDISGYKITPSKKEARELADSITL